MCNAHRIYGARAADEMQAWLAKSGKQAGETKWDGPPSLEVLRALPQAKDDEPLPGQASARSTRTYAVLEDRA
jgi:hypothetical protein